MISSDQAFRESVCFESSVVPRPPICWVNFMKAKVLHKAFRYYKVSSLCFLEQEQAAKQKWQR